MVPNIFIFGAYKILVLNQGPITHQSHMSKDNIPAINITTVICDNL